MYNDYAMAKKPTTKSTTTSLVQFKELPPANFGRKNPLHTKYAGIADELKANPGEWGLVGENLPTSLSYAIRNDTQAAFRPAGHYESTVRNTTRNRSDIWARYIGENAEKAK